jgi:peptide/nickel transport system substrate-binding protein
LEGLAPDQLAEIGQAPSLRLVVQPSLAYHFLGLNQRAPFDGSQPHPVFGDSLVRRALAMAVDRERLVRTVLDSIGTVALGPAPRALIADTAAIRQIAYDPAAARALLDSAGWVDTNNDAVRERHDVPLAFDMLVPNSSPTRQRIAVLLQEQLRAIGVQVTPVPLEIDVLNARILGKAFDSYLGGWIMSPGLVGMRQTWMSTGASNTARRAAIGRAPSSKR